MKIVINNCYEEDSLVLDTELRGNNSFANYVFGLVDYSLKEEIKSLSPTRDVNTKLKVVSNEIYHSARYDVLERVTNLRYVKVSNRMYTKTYSFKGLEYDIILMIEKYSTTVKLTIVYPEVVYYDVDVDEYDELKKLLYVEGIHHKISNRRKITKITRN